MFNTMRANDVFLRLKRIALITLFCFSVTSTASAQTRRVEPEFESATVRALTIPVIDSTIDSAQGGERRSDSLWNGALIGAGVAVASGLFLCTRTEPWENCRDDVGPMLRIGAIGAGIGIGIDALIRRRSPSSTTPGSARLHAAPIVGRQAGGLRMAISF
jgi:hypothetical protein